MLSRRRSRSLETWNRRWIAAKLGGLCRPLSWTVPLFIGRDLRSGPVCGLQT
jgi:hypothetical protein